MNIGLIDSDIWVQDVTDLMERIRILMEQDMRPYIMRHENHKKVHL